MGSLRQDPLTGRWVIFAGGRSARPNEYPLRFRDTSDAANCPFCPGHEDQTTGEILVTGRPAAAPANGPGWRMRVFGNMFPALAPEGAEAEPADEGPGASRPAAGHHEVAVYSPRHADGPADLTLDGWSELLGLLRERARAIARHPDVRYVSPFCNHGPEAGATLVHPHMQIIGMPAVPLLAREKADGLARHRDAHGTCQLCDLAETEAAAGTRLIARSEHWTVLAPWASRFPWEVLLVPRRHGSGLQQATDAELAGLGAALRPVCGGLVARHGDLSVNLVVHGAEVDAAGEPVDRGSYHWHVEILPRLSRPAGFEVGTGTTINAVWPEDVAAALRTEGTQS